MKTYYIKSRRRGISYIKQKQGRLTGLATLHRNFLLKCVIEGKVQGRIDVRGRQGRRHEQVLDDLKKRKDTGN
jgi:hypothetical protein